ncbi:MAG: ABC transporter substrate-binding protein [Chloroflexi bacterium]|nr:ABC transporter substrate-binding protein [Chloroflexota bacterium]MBV9601217.1 ABC transporter substrate-binding protein [Chloroflexota bacterium]
MAGHRAPKPAILIAAVALLLSVGVPSSPAAAAGGAFSQAATGGGTFTGAWVGPCCVGIANANPLIAGGDQHFLSKIYEPLVTYSIDTSTGGYGPIVSALARDWSTSGDGLTWTFHLQPGVTWHDGSPFTADDVVFTLTLCESPTVGCVYGGGISNISGAADVKSGKSTTLTGVAAPDPQTVTITTDTPNAAMLDALSVIWIVQKKSLSSIPIDQITKSPYWTTPGQAVGTGPFKITNYVDGQFMELSRYDGYWRGRPVLDKIVRREFKDPATALLAFDRGEIDFTYLTADEVTREQANTNATIIAGPSQVDNAVVFNPLVNPAFGNKLFKQAMQYAIDRKSIISSLYNGAGQTLPCLFGNPAYVAPDTQMYDYNPDMAKSLITQSGVDMGSLPTFTFDTYYNDPLSLNVMTAIQQNWADVGFNVTIKQMDSAAWTNQYYKEGTSQVSFIGAQNGPDGNIAATYFLSTASQESGAGNNGWKGYVYSNPQVDMLINQGRSTFDPAQRGMIYQSLCKVLADDLPWNIMWQTTRYWIVSNKVQNFQLTPAPGGGSYYDAAETWSIQQ